MPPNCKLKIGQVFSNSVLLFEHIFLVLSSLYPHAWEMLEAKENNETHQEANT